MIVPKQTLLALLVGLPLGSGALELPEHATNALVIMPPSAATTEAPEVRAASARLRDALRQPVSDGEVTGKPYRLSAEERQRLRELLRVQPDQTTRTR